MYKQLYDSDMRLTFRLIDEGQQLTPLSPHGVIIELFCNFAHTQLNSRSLSFFFRTLAWYTCECMQTQFSVWYGMIQMIIFSCKYNYLYRVIAEAIFHSLQIEQVWVDESSSYLDVNCIMDVISEGVVVLVQKDQCYKTFIPKKGRYAIVSVFLRCGSSAQDLTNY